MEVIQAAIQNILDDYLHKLDPASPDAEARRVAESLVKWSLNKCNEKIHKFIKPFLTNWKNPLLFRKTHIVHISNFSTLETHKI